MNDNDKNKRCTLCGALESKVYEFEIWESDFDKLREDGELEIHMIDGRTVRMKYVKPEDEKT